MAILMARIGNNKGIIMAIHGNAKGHYMAILMAINGNK